jgi:hypothetical protein
MSFKGQPGLYKFPGQPRLQSETLSQNERMNEWIDSTPSKFPKVSDYLIYQKKKKIAENTNNSKYVLTLKYPSPQGYITFVQLV